MEKNNHNSVQSANTIANPIKKGWIIAFLGWITMVLGLFLAIIAGQLIKQAGASSQTMFIVQAIVCAVLIIPAVFLIVRRFRLQDKFLPLNKKTLLHFLSGIGLAGGLASLGVWLATQNGWITDVKWDFSFELLTIIVIQALISLGYEAIPEELTLRGLVYSGLRTQLSAFIAFVTQVILFVLVPITVDGLKYAVGMSFQSQISIPYILLLLLFGVNLQLFRIITGSLWASIGFHITFLLCSRYLFGPNERLLSFTEEAQGVSQVMVMFGFVILGSCVVLSLFQAMRFYRSRNFNKKVSA
jgi:membrane protease YdiL (CAAX protease family)